MLRNTILMSAALVLLVIGHAQAKESVFWTRDRQAAVVAVQVIPNDASGKPRLGTGFFVTSKGLFVTAAHLLGEDAGRVQFSLTGMGGTWIDFNPNGFVNLGSDLILLKAYERAEPYPILPLACPSNPPAREALLHYSGFPFGAEFDVRDAKVSANFGLTGGLQLDANAAGGFSGGPVVDLDGYIVGVVSAGVKAQPGFLQVTPISLVKSKLEEAGAVFSVCLSRPPRERLTCDPAADSAARLRSKNGRTIFVSPYDFAGALGAEDVAKRINSSFNAYLNVALGPELSTLRLPEVSIVTEDLGVPFGRNEELRSLACSLNALAVVGGTANLAETTDSEKLVELLSMFLLPNDAHPDLPGVAWIEDRFAVAHLSNIRTIAKQFKSEWKFRTILAMAEKELRNARTVEEYNHVKTWISRVATKQGLEERADLLALFAIYPWSKP